MSETKTPETTSPPDKASKPERVYSTELSSLMDRAEYYWVRSGSSSDGAVDPEEKSKYKVAADRYSAISQLLYDLVRNEDLCTTDQAVERLTATRGDILTHLEKRPTSKSLISELDTIDSTFRFFDDEKKPNSRRDYGDALHWNRRTVNRTNRIKSEKNELIEGKAADRDSIISTIDSIYRAQGETSASRSLETKFRLTTKKLEGLKRSGGDEGVREYVLDMLKHFDKETNSELTVSDISSLELFFVSSRLASKVAGHSLERPVFVIKDKEQRQRITGENWGGFMSPEGIGHLMPMSGVEDLPVIISGPSQDVIQHEVLHSIDEKCMGQRRTGYNRLLAEAFAYLGEESDWDKDKPGTVAINWGKRLHSYYDSYTNGSENQITKDEYDVLAKKVRDRARAMFVGVGDGDNRLGLDIPTIMKTFAICDTLDEFFQITDGILQIGKQKTAHKA